MNSKKSEVYKEQLYKHFINGYVDIAIHSARISHTMRVKTHEKNSELSGVFSNSISKILELNRSIIYDHSLSLIKRHSLIVYSSTALREVLASLLYEYIECEEEHDKNESEKNTCCIFLKLFKNMINTIFNDVLGLLKEQHESKKLNPQEIKNTLRLYLSTLDSLALSEIRHMSIKENIRLNISYKLFISFLEVVSNFFSEIIENYEEMSRENLLNQKELLEDFFKRLLRNIWILLEIISEGDKLKEDGTTTVFRKGLNTLIKVWKKLNPNKIKTENIGLINSYLRNVSTIKLITNLEQQLPEDTSVKQNAKNIYDNLLSFLVQLLRSLIARESSYTDDTIEESIDSLKKLLLYLLLLGYKHGFYEKIPQDYAKQVFEIPNLEKTISDIEKEKKIEISAPSLGFGPWKRELTEEDIKVFKKLLYEYKQYRMSIN